jgi:molybdate transport repressor ModE-like protein
MPANRYLAGQRPRGPDTDVSPASDRSARTPLRRTFPGGPGGLGREVQLENIHPLRLRLLLAIERTGSISAAATECAIGQPSASMHLRGLETAIGRRLVCRTHGGSMLTPAGRVVASHAARVLATLDGMLRTLNTRDGGELSLSASLSVAVGLIPGLLRQFSDRYPSVSVRLRTLPSQAVVQEIIRAAADIGIAADVPATDGLERRELLIDELVGIAPSGLLGANGCTISLGELARNSLLVGAEGSSTRAATERCLARADFRPSRLWVFDSYVAIKRAVAEGLGVSFASRRLVDAEVQRGELSTFRVWGVGAMTRQMYVVQSPQREPTAYSQAFTTMLVAAAGPGGPDEERSHAIERMGEM